MRRSLIALLLVGPLLVACTGDDAAPPTSQPQASPQETTAEISNSRSFADADSLVNELNDIGVACEPFKKGSRDARRARTSRGPAIPHRDATVCQLSNGAWMSVLIVRDGQEAFDKYFAMSHGPSYQLYGETWLLIVPNTAPAGVVDEIRSEFEAKG